jgi:hypothetical protein
VRVYFPVSAWRACVMGLRMRGGGGEWAVPYPLPKAADNSTNQSTWPSHGSGEGNNLVGHDQGRARIYGGTSAPHRKCG